MKLSRKKINVVITGALLLALALVGLAQGRRPQGPPDGGGFHDGPGGPRGGLVPFARDLNLTDEQKAQIQKLTDSLEESTQALREQLRAQHGDEFAALKDGAFDEAAVRAAAQARANVQVELEVARARTMAQIYALLTAEQKAKINELRQQFEQRRTERGPRRGDARPEQSR